MSLDENGAHLDTPICCTRAVLDPYDEYGNMRASCAFTFENNCLRNCEGVALGIEEMSEDGEVECDGCEHVLRLCSCHQLLFGRGFRPVPKHY